MSGSFPEPLAILIARLELKPLTPIRIGRVGYSPVLSPEGSLGVGLADGRTAPHLLPSFKPYSILAYAGESPGLSNCSFADNSRAYARISRL